MYVKDYGCPCKDCQDREVGCHSGCEGYKSWKVKMDAINEARQIERERYDTMSESRIRVIWKSRRYGKQSNRRKASRED